MDQGCVCHVRDRVKGAVYIGRANRTYGLAVSPFANPFRIGRHGDRAAVLALYEEYLLGHPELLALLPTLAGKPLACWCRHRGEEPTADTACHGDVLLELIGRGEW